MSKKSILMSIPIKDGCLPEYLAFAKESQQRKTEYAEMLKRYDIDCAKVWYQKIVDSYYVFVYHEVGDTFEQKMKGWDSSTDPFDTWFRESIMSVYDISCAADMGALTQVVDFKA